MLIRLPILSTYNLWDTWFLIVYPVFPSSSSASFSCSFHLPFIIHSLWFQLINIFTGIDHSMIYICPLRSSYTPGGLTLMNNWFGYLIVLSNRGQLFSVFFIKSLPRRRSMKIQSHPMHGMACIGYLTSNHQSDEGQCFGSYGTRWPLLYSWRWILQRNHTSIWFVSLSLASILQYIAIVYYM